VQSGMERIQGDPWCKADGAESLVQEDSGGGESGGGVRKGSQGSPEVI
jgi:hypothetical protein